MQRDVVQHPVKHLVAERRTAATWAAARSPAIYKIWSKVGFFIGAFFHASSPAYNKEVDVF